jgi:DNA sulfur modification protein DndE
MHIDDGLNLLNEEVASNSNIDGFDFLIEKIEVGLAEII